MQDNLIKFKEATEYLPQEIKSILLNEFKKDEILWEIRLIAGCAPQIKTACGITTLNTRLTKKHFEDCLFTLTKGSVHSFQNELALGFIPLGNGNRAGISGTAVVNCDNKITSIRDINAVVIRVANEIFDVSDEVVVPMLRSGLKSLIIAGAPCSGKTTFLRDIARKLANKGLSVVVVDERQELFGGLSSCIVLKGFNKTAGIRLATRSLSPQVIICDEIADFEEADALSKAINSGVYIICSVHAGNKLEFFKRGVCKKLMESGCFEGVVFLKREGKGKIEEVIKI
ncbi:MAG: ATPase, T2SS/T4P/T4SS family [Oscillospiraceae bacterium]